MKKENRTKNAKRAWLGTLTLIVTAAIAPVALDAQPAEAAPYINCDYPVYNGSVSASVTCYGASSGQVRLKASCWSWLGAPVRTATAYGVWVNVPAGGRATLYWNGQNWCTGWNETWRVDPEIR